MKRVRLLYLLPLGVGDFVLVFLFVKVSLPVPRTRRCMQHGQLGIKNFAGASSLYNHDPWHTHNTPSLAPPPIAPRAE